ncbi:MAG: SPOR domain-containing protein [Treponema sp.]|nr:SPOR domain-containing protein [Treponema sp.]MEE3434302.1 SPOR domain-containing protein [Treponema sp.]
MKLLALFSSLMLFASLAFGQSAKETSQKAMEASSAGEAVEILKKQIPQAKNAADKRALLAFLGGLQEQLGAYKDASASYAQAAGISAPNVEGFPKKTNPQLVLDAVRCSLCSGDSATADNYLNSAVRNSQDETIQAYIKLYEVWSRLCQIESNSQLDESVALLKAYSDFPSMKAVQPSVLLTLWYVTGQESWGKKLRAAFPKSPEAAIVAGNVQMTPAPFWYFMPKKGSALEAAAENAAESQSVPMEKSDDSSAGADSDDSSQSEGSEKIKKQQLGLFKSRDNAQGLCDRLKEKGFKPYITEETRPSGTTYFIVVVDENAKGNIGEQLRSAGFECYPIF